MRQIIENISSDTQIFIDECFIELVDDGDKKNTMIEMVSDYKNLVILRSMTKSFCLERKRRSSKIRYDGSKGLILFREI